MSGNLTTMSSYHGREESTAEHFGLPGEQSKLIQGNLLLVFTRSFNH